MVGLLAATVALVGFIGIAKDVVFKESMVGVDMRVLNLVPNIRTPEQTAFFSFFTSSASSVTLIFFLVVLAVLSWVRRQWLLPIIFAIALMFDLVSSAILKYFIGRPRPDQALSLVSEDNFSFPSGHTLAATIIFGLTAYFLFRTVKSATVKLMTLISGIVIICLVGASRIYLGVHFPSDVLASILFGLFILCLIITATEINQRYKLQSRYLFTPSIKEPIVITLLATFLFSLLLNSHLTHIRPATIHVQTRPLATINESTVSKLPKYSETLTGTKMEPISIIYIGGQSQIEAAFKRAGWYKADPPTISNTLKATIIGAQNKQYLNAPVTPAYLNSEPENIAFQKPTDTNTLQQRHHTRIWKTGFTVSDMPVWVATASFDKGCRYWRSYKIADTSH